MSRETSGLRPEWPPFTSQEVKGAVPTPPLDTDGNQTLSLNELEAFRDSLLTLMNQLDGHGAPSLADVDHLLTSDQQGRPGILDWAKTVRLNVVQLWEKHRREWEAKREALFAGRREAIEHGEVPRPTHEPFKWG